MALMLAAQQFQQNRMQRFCGKLLVQKARDHFINSRPYKQRNQDVRNIPVPDMPESAYRYVLYEAHGPARVLYAYGILGQQQLDGTWMTLAITAPFSNNRAAVAQLTKLCTDQQLEPIHILDVIHDFMDLETRTL